MNRKKVFDLLERTFWTFVQGGLSVIGVAQLDLPLYAAPFVAAVLSAAKSFVAGRLGNRASVSTLPAELDPATHN